MSSTAAQVRSRLPRVTPRAAQAAVQRARLSVVPRVRTRAPRVPFVTLVSVILLGGVVGLLMFNTSMQQASFQATALQRQASDLGARQEALELDLQALRSPARIASAAQRQGMVIPTSAGILDLGTGRVSGAAVPADGAPLPLTPPPAKRPSLLDPPTVTSTSRSTSAATSTGRGRADTGNARRAGAPRTRG
ncbi:hypothetical protein E8D34_02920 [Nocardioides sp. GY 10113]|uniref:hypothetical protein n=1 Tax=Nocardioides sp. GY 10113 TaxID=2569761 RepID=UPI0010A91F3C|nr:hypothetical protein [Nocardioides sp. GY 10113]TIC88645.1 hypothetical protein E8D34_02920 [Nocardioides sp. GY 10113]